MTLPGDRVDWHVHECDGPDSFTIASAEAHRILRALKAAASHLAAVDESNAQANLAEVRHRPLTREVVLMERALDRLLHPAEVVAADSPGELVDPLGASVG